MGSRRGRGRGVANDVSYEGGGVGIARKFNSLPFIDRRNGVSFTYIKQCRTPFFYLKAKTEENLLRYWYSKAIHKVASVTSVAIFLGISICSGLLI